LNLTNTDKPENKDMTRKEEPTKAVTPDKLDRSLRDEEMKTGDGHLKPYPLTEEEATPNIPRSEESFVDDEKLKSKSKISTNDTKRNETEVVSD
jgi:hypothetical protein